jgi:membrane fusion protein (multidrug efflux system)
MGRYESHCTWFQGLPRCQYKAALKRTHSKRWRAERKPQPRQAITFARASLWLAGAVLCGLLSGCGQSPAPDPAQAPTPPRSVSVVHLRRGEITRSITLPGTIIAYQAATLYAKIPGYLKTIAVDKGDAVKQGEVLAEIEDPELLAELPKYQAELEVADANYKRIGEAAKKAPDLVVPLTVDEAKGKYDVAVANLKRINDLLAYAKVTAPFAGVITKRWVDPGAFIAAGTSGSAATTAAVVTMMDFSRVRIDVAVPESEVPLVTTNVPAAVTVEELPQKVFSGNVTRFEYALDQTTKTMIAEIEIHNPKLELRPGMYAIVRLGIERKSDTLLAPADAIVTEKAGAFVFLAENNQAKKTPVQTGFNDGTNVEILSGAKPEQSLILAGKQSLNNGQPIAIKEAK